MRIVIPLLAFVLMLVAADPRAAQIEGIYEAIVPVADRSDANRRNAARSALGLVLIKLTGDRASASSSATAQIRRAADRYVQQFSYERSDINIVRDPGTEALSIHFLFDPRILAAALRDIGYPVWGRERPTILVWIVMKRQAEEFRIISSEEDLSITEVLDDQSEVRGLPVILPLLDIDDQYWTIPADVASGDLDGVLELSHRYGAEAVLIGSLDEFVPGLWEGTWYLQLDEEWLNWGTQGDSPELMVDEGFNTGSDVIAGKFADPLLQSSEEAVEISVNAVNTIDDYARISLYLESLEAVTSLDVAQVATGSVVFRLQVRGGMVGFDQIVALGDVLRSFANQPGYYQLVPD